MSNSWLIKNYRYSLNRRAPTTADVPDATPFVWVDTVNDQAYYYRDGWQTKALPDQIIPTDTGYIYVVSRLDYDRDIDESIIIAELVTAGLISNPSLTESPLIEDTVTGTVTRTISGASTYLATNDGGAMFFVNGEDLSRFAGSLGDTPASVTLTDAAGKTASAYCANAGGGEAFSSEQISSWANASVYPYETLTTSGTDLSSAINTTTQGRCACGIHTSGRLYKMGYNLTLNSGQYPGFLLANSPTAPSGVWGGGTLQAGANDIIFTPYGTGLVPALYNTAVCDWGSTFSLVYYTDVPATGLHLVSEQDGGTRNMASVDDGFNPNTIQTIIITSN